LPVAPALLTLTRHPSPDHLPAFLAWPSPFTLADPLFPCSPAACILTDHPLTDHPLTDHPLTAW